MPLLHTLQRLTIACAASVTFAHASTVFAADTDSDDASAVVTAFHAAIRVGDTPTVMKLLATDATILEQGGRESRDEYRNHHLPEDIKFAQAVPTRREGVQARVSGNVAWVTSLSASQGTFQGSAVNVSGSELVVLTKGADGWSIRSVHWSSRKRK